MVGLCNFGIVASGCLLTCGANNCLKCNGMVEKRCPVCGTAVVGRIDKVFCCDDCRSYYHNARYRKRIGVLHRNKEMLQLWNNAAFLAEKKSHQLLKFIVILSGICKIISTFGTPKLKDERRLIKN